MKKAPTPNQPMATSADVLAGLQTIAECIQGIEKERTEQRRLDQAARIEVERIHTTRDLMLAYLERSFDERRDTFRQLFERLDQAIDRGDVQATSAVLDSVLKLAHSSPFAALAEVKSTRDALQKRENWEF